jgi:hypothetical protein
VLETTREPRERDPHRPGLGSLAATHCPREATRSALIGLGVALARETENEHDEQIEGEEDCNRCSNESPGHR